MKVAADHSTHSATRIQRRSDSTPFFAPQQATEDRGVVAQEAFFQPKLTVGALDDRYEREADRVADRVVELTTSENSTPGPITDNTTVQAKPGPALSAIPISRIQRSPEPDPLDKPEPEMEELPVQRKPIFESEGDGQVQRKCTACGEQQEEKKVQRKCEACEEEESLQRSGDGGFTASNDFAGKLNSSKGGGSPLPSATRRSMESAIGADFSGVRVHTGSHAAGLSNQIGAQAFTHGNDVYFNRGKYAPGTASGDHLLAHELTHTVQQGGSRAIRRHPVAPTPTDRKDRDFIFGSAPGTGISFQDFKSYTDRQADWFTEPTLTAADRTVLWSLLSKANPGSPALSGVGDVRIRELAPVTDTQWLDLIVYCRGADPTGHTVRIAPSGSVSSRIALGRALRLLETKIPGEVLELTVTQAQLEAVRSNALAPIIVDYWNQFSPHLQQTAGSVATGVDSEFQKIINLMNGVGFAPFLSLHGRVRSLHRFPVSTLQALKLNFLDETRTKRLYLILFTGTDYNGAFLKSIPLFQRLIEDRSKLVLMLEGQVSLNAISTEVPLIATKYGQPDSDGNHRIAQVMLAGHGGNRSMELAGTGSPNVRNGKVHYPTNGESLDLDQNRVNTERLLSTLLDNLDPATARIVFAGCLVGSNSAPVNNPATGLPMTADEIRAHVTDPAHESLVAATRRLATTHQPTATIEGARASVGLGSATSLTDGAGNLHVEYSFDPDALGTASAYLVSGREPEGLMRAAVEVAASNPVVAANHLRTRLGLAARTGWYDQCARLFAQEALRGVAAGAGIDIVRVNKLAHMTDPYFLAYWAMRPVATFNSVANPHATLAENMYRRIVAAPAMVAATDQRTKEGRFILEQSWSILKASRITQLLAYVNGQPNLTIPILRRHLDTRLLALRSAALFPGGGATSIARVRLAIAWHRKDSSNTDARAFLDAQVDDSSGTPTLRPPVASELPNPADRRALLISLGRLVPGIPSGGGGGATLHPANADVFDPPGPAMNDVRIEPNIHQATVVAPAHVLRIHATPANSGAVFHWARRGDNLQVMGFVHNWAAVDINGRLGFAYNRFLSPPPP